ncbi:hypothetical protein H6792_03030 [Candidatus Nomurabacteria bacterium]|nr:hypothetical protein [Candidatus Nomurabacteria bacterium]
MNPKSPIKINYQTRDGQDKSIIVSTETQPIILSLLENLDCKQVLEINDPDQGQRLEELCFALKLTH